LDQVILHTVVHHSSTNRRTHIRTHGQKFETSFIR